MSYCYSTTLDCEFVAAEVHMFSGFLLLLHPVYLLCEFFYYGFLTNFIVNYGFLYPSNCNSPKNTSASGFFFTRCVVVFVVANTR